MILQHQQTLQKWAFLMEFKEIDGRYIYGKKNLVKVSRLYEIWHLKLKFS